MRELNAVLLGWFLITTYGSASKFDFATELACNMARTDLVAQLGSTNAKRIGPCHYDPPTAITLAPFSPTTLTIDGTLTITEMP